MFGLKLFSIELKDSIPLKQKPWPMISANNCFHTYIIFKHLPTTITSTYNICKHLPRRRPIISADNNYHTYIICKQQLPYLYNLQTSTCACNICKHLPMTITSTYTCNICKHLARHRPIISANNIYPTYKVSHLPRPIHSV